MLENGPSSHPIFAFSGLPTRNGKRQQKTMENHGKSPCSTENSLQMVIFNSYVESPKGRWSSHTIPMELPGSHGLVQDQQIDRAIGAPLNIPTREEKLMCNLRKISSRVPRLQENITHPRGKTQQTFELKYVKISTRRNDLANFQNLDQICLSIWQLDLMLVLIYLIT